MVNEDDGGDGVRLDVWLDVACVFRTRSEAQKACRSGKVDANGQTAKPNRRLRVGDELEISRPFGRKQRVRVLAVADRHVAKAEARRLYEDLTPPPTPGEIEVRRQERLFQCIRAGLRFELEALARQIRFYLHALAAFLGPGMPLHVSLTDLAAAPRGPLLQEQLLAPLQAQFPAATFAFDPERASGRGYYRDVCFHIEATHPSAGRLQLVDGGSVDWTQKLLGSAKERLVISGLGSDRLCTAF